MKIIAINFGICSNLKIEINEPNLIWNRDFLTIISILKAKKTMLSMSMTRDRQKQREQKAHTTAIQRALQRKAQREKDRQENSEVLTEEEEILDEEPSKTSKEFYNVCSETTAKKGSGKSTKKESNSEKKKKDHSVKKEKKRSSSKTEN